MNTMASHGGGLEYSELSHEKPVWWRVDRDVPEDCFSSVFGLWLVSWDVCVHLFPGCTRLYLVVIWGHCCIPVSLNRPAPLTSTSTLLHYGHFLHFGLRFTHVASPKQISNFFKNSRNSPSHAIPHSQSPLFPTRTCPNAPTNNMAAI